MNFNFYMPVKVVSGEDCVLSAGNLLEGLGKRCLVVTGGSSAIKSGALSDAVKALETQGIDYSVFNKIGPNPLASVCHEAGREAARFDAQFILGIGGGSPLDAAKSAAVYAANPQLSPDDIFEMHFDHQALPLALIGTTAGTGSEVTATSVLTSQADNQKRSITHPYCYARLAFANPRYTDSCPYDITVSVALDAVSHSIEGFYSVRGGDTAKAAAVEALRLIIKELYKFRTSPGVLPDKASRDALYYGSLWAGLALNFGGTGFAHPAGYVLTTVYGVPHGRACAVFLPDYLMLNAPVAPQLTERLLAATSTSLDELCGLISALTGLFDFKLTPPQCEEYAFLLKGKANLKNAARPSTVEEIRGIYAKLFS